MSLVALFATVAVHAEDALSPLMDRTDLSLSISAGKFPVQKLADEVTRQTGVAFSYSKTLAGTMVEVSDVKVTSGTINDIMNVLFTDTGIKWKVRDNMVALYFPDEVPIMEPAPSKAAETVHKVSGQVKDKAGAPLGGAVVFVKDNPSIAAVTDFDGRYAIDVQVSQVVVVSLMGYADHEFTVKGDAVVDVVLNEDVQFLDEVVVVGYGAQKRSSLTGAISTVSKDEILRAPTMSVSNMVGSRVAGIAAVQSSGQPGEDNASLTIRGQGNIIYVIDGIRREAADFNGLDPNEIESVSVLKDASAVAVYGLDANGAFVVTTKKGSSHKVTINYSGTVGVSQNAQEQEWLDGPGYAYWYNKARVLQGDKEVFTAEQVRKMIAGEDGWGNTNWYDIIYGTGFRHSHNISASGGTDKVHVFTSLGYLDEQGNINNYDYDRINIRTNVDAKIGEGWRLDMGIAGRIEDRNRPYFSADPSAFMNIAQQTCFALPYVPLYVEDEDGKKYPTAIPTNGSPVTPMASRDQSGYSRSKTTYVQTNFALQYDAPWLKGLNVKFQGAYDAAFTTVKSLRTPMEVMLLTLPNKTTKALTYKKGYYSVIGDTPILSESASNYSVFTTQSSISYNNMFGKHSLGLLALAETREKRSQNIGATGYGLDFIQLDELSQITNLTTGGVNKAPEISGNSGHSRVAGFVGRLNYNYAEKYFLEASFRHDGSYLFGGMNKRWVTLPGASVAWRISQEDWFDADWVTNLKLRAGIGKTASSGVSAFQWMNTMAPSPNSVVIGGSSQTSISTSVLGNPNLTWAQCLNYNVGVDVNLWNGMLGVEADAFYKYEYGKLSTVTGAYPPSMGGYYFNSANVNEVDYKGFDLTLSHHNTVGDFFYSMKLIWSYTYGRWLKYAGDSENTPDYQRLTGKQIGSKIGLVDDGLFQTWEEIENSATDLTRPSYPGYIKYVDMNGDGTITLAQDKAYVGKSTIPTHTGSFNFNGSWKGFDVDILFSWGLGHEVGIQGVYNGVSGVASGTHGATSYSRPFYQLGNAPVYLVVNCWTPEHTDAEFPRLEIIPQSLSNGYASTFWYRSGNYIRLKTAQVGYTFPKKWMDRLKIQKLRIYMEGYNLLTLSALTKYNIDPEAPSVTNGYYPQQRTMSLGLNLTF